MSVSKPTAKAAPLRSFLSDVLSALGSRVSASPDFEQATINTLVEEQGPQILDSLLDGETSRGSGSTGSPADVPWTAIFPEGSSSAQDGFYLVYLFSKDGQRAYLSLNQGTERLKKRGGRPLAKRCIDIRKVVGGTSDLELALDLSSSNTRPGNYEKGSAYAIEYRHGDLPAESVLEHDLTLMLGLLRTGIEARLSWPPDLEPLHLLFKWSAESEPRTIEIHKEIAEREGAVWWGKWSASGRSTAESKIDALREQLDAGLPTFAYLYRRGSPLYRARIRQVSSEPPAMPDQRFPNYYGPDDCTFFALLDEFETLVDEPPLLLALASNPSAEPSVLEGALGNQTNPLFVYQWFGAVNDQPPTVDFEFEHLSDVVVQFAAAVAASGLRYGVAEKHERFIRTFLCSLATKRFLILTGLSGSGKTRIAQVFGEWLGPGRYKILPVRPDWTSPEALLGYENTLANLDGDRMVWSTPEALQFIASAGQKPDEPFLLILDEMNLAHVERYFADILSGMETGAPVVPNVTQSEKTWLRDRTNSRLPLPSNLFIVGTVNVDETTYMFSPKVLDRANTIEFRVQSGDLGSAMTHPESEFEPASIGCRRGFLEVARSVEIEPGNDLAPWLRELHELLCEHDREFGHRTYSEALRFERLHSMAGGHDSLVTLDLQVLQKILPKLHGSVREISPVLNDLAAWCFKGPGAKRGENFDPLNPGEQIPVLPMSFSKLQRMTKRLRANHFVSFAE